MHSNTEEVPTFEQNMASLTSLKEELLRLHYIYSPVHISTPVGVHQLSSACHHWQFAFPS